MALLQENNQPAELGSRSQPHEEKLDRHHRADRNPHEAPKPHKLPPDGQIESGPRAPVRPGPLRRLLKIIAALIAIPLIVAGAAWWFNARHYESTDDAFIDTRTVSISAQVSGLIVGVPVADNQPVTKGVPLVRIDPRDYQVAVEQAQAQLEHAYAQVANFGAQIDAQQARLNQAQKQVTEVQAALQYARQEDKRARRLLQTGAGTVQAAQQSRSDLTQKQAALAAAQANATATDKQLAVLRTQRRSALAQVDVARAALDKAKLALSRTTILAPQDGHVTNLTAAVGAYVQPGLALMSIVPRKVWVTANFKETALADMRVGQPVDIEIDAYPGRVFHGHVDSIQAGTGTAFSLLPPENATGNFVKVVQRVPVKIDFDKPPNVYLGPGMSVVPYVKVR
jgi:membrane fusion protein, multidrug efflux system